MEPTRSHSGHIVRADMGPACDCGARILPQARRFASRTRYDACTGRPQRRNAVPDVATLPVQAERAISQADNGRSHGTVRRWVQRECSRGDDFGVHCSRRHRLSDIRVDNDSRLRLFVLAGLSLHWVVGQFQRRPLNVSFRVAEQQTCYGPA